MIDLVQAVRETSSGVANVVLERNREIVGSGSGFLIDGHLIGAHHVLLATGYDVARIRFGDDPPTEGIRLGRSTVSSGLAAASPEQEHDLAVLSIDEPELRGRHRFAVDREADIEPGRRVLVLGFPYGRSHLTSHVAYVSAVYCEGATRVLQLDGSINPSHSGGPVVDLQSLKVIAYVVRTLTGLMDDFDDLVAALNENIRQLAPSGGGHIVIGGIDPREAFRATMAAMRRLAANLRRSANVGIGFAFSASHIPSI